LNALDHEKYMRRAIQLAANNPDFPFGAVIADQASGAIVGEGWNRSSQNPTWHGEIDAINHWAANRKAGGVGQNEPRPALALYTTAEPCPMCQSAILWSGIQTVVYGTSIRFLQSQGWAQIDILAEEVIRRSSAGNCTLMGGVLAEECNALFTASKIAASKITGATATGAQRKAAQSAAQQ
jgi:tRNA(adenine34) deaminase